MIKIALMYKYFQDLQPIFFFIDLSFLTTVDDRNITICIFFVYIASIVIFFFFIYRFLQCLHYLVYSHPSHGLYLFEIDIIFFDEVFQFGLDMFRVLFDYIF